ncbi:hypothetical protein [Dyella nitratireducens]|nr:hypothetical protein [Dyella nitratireducens]
MSISTISPNYPNNFQQTTHAFEQPAPKQPETSSPTLTSNATFPAHSEGSTIGTSSSSARGSGLDSPAWQPPPPNPSQPGTPQSSSTHSDEPAHSYPRPPEIHYSEDADGALNIDMSGYGTTQLKEGEDDPIKANGPINAHFEDVASVTSNEDGSVTIRGNGKHDVSLESMGSIGPKINGPYTYEFSPADPKNTAEGVEFIQKT